MKKGKLLAEGRTALIYEWGLDKVIKLFKPAFPADLAEREYKRAAASQKTGFKVPKVYKLVNYEGKSAIIFQKINGIDLIKKFQQDPKSIFTVAKMCAELHVEMHAMETDLLSSQKESLIWFIEHAQSLNNSIKERVIAYLQELPDNNKLCHGDFHPGNIMLTNEGPIIIDWMDGRSGHPLADVARTLIITTTGVLPPNTESRNLMLLGRWLFGKLYIYHYFRLSDLSRTDLEAWILPIAAARLSEGIPEEEENLLEIVYQHLDKLSEKKTA